MTTSLYMPDLKVEIAFDSGWSTPAASRTWTDVSTYVEFQFGIEVRHGRADRVGVCDASMLSLTLNNRDGRFTAGLASGAYYPNVKISRPIRVKSTPVGGAESVRFVGFVDIWPVEWDGSDAMAYARITATSRLARLGRAKKVGNIIEAAILAESPTLFYPLTEGSGALFASDRSGNGGPNLLPVLDGDGPITFGSGVGPVGEAVVLGGANTTGPTRLQGTSSTTLIEVGDFPAVSILTCVRADGISGFHSVILAQIDDNNMISNPGFDLEIGVNSVEGGMFGGKATGTPGGIADGDAAAIGYTYTGPGTKTSKVWVDGVMEGSAVNTPPTTVGAPITQIRALMSANYPDGAAQCYLAIWIGTELTTTQMEDLSDAMTGWVGDLPGNRIERYALLAGIAATEVAADDGITPMAAIDATGKALLELMRTVETTEGGILFDAKDGTLTFHARGRRYTATSAFTLSIVSQQVEADYSPRLDLTNLQNDVTATLTDGTAAARAVDETSVEDYGTAGDSIELATTDANEPHAAAWWNVNTYAEPRPRVPSLTVDFLALTGALQASLYAASVSTRFDVTGHPSQAATSSGDYFIEGWTETYGLESAQFNFNVSDAAPYVSTFVLGDATRGQLDSTYVIAY